MPKVVLARVWRPGNSLLERKSVMVGRSWDPVSVPMPVTQGVGWRRREIRRRTRGRAGEGGGDRREDGGRRRKEESGQGEEE